MPSNVDSKNQKKWIVKDGEGKIFGPFNTEQVLQQIDRGYFVGGEQVAPYPGGRWTAISKAPEFYDRLLDVLAAEGKRMETTTGIDPEATQKVDRDVTEDLEEEITDPLTQAVAPRRNGTVGQTNFPQRTGLSQPPTGTFLPQGPAIELTDLKQIEKNEGSGSRSKLPLILIGVAAVLIIAALIIPESGPKTEGTRIHLLLPRKGQPAIDLPTAKEKFTRAITSFARDTFGGYQRAQDELVQIVESTPQRTELLQARAEWLSALCLTYRELWPYAYQDSTDLKAVTWVMQEAKRADPGGRYGSTCEIVQLLLNGRTLDAQGLTESLLVEDGQSPPLFEIRGDIYASLGDNEKAATYFSQARALWGAWQKSAVQEGRAKKKTHNYPAAVQLFRGVLKTVPEHPVAAIELGLIEGLEFNHFDDGINLLKPALEGGERVPSQLQSAGFFGMAQIYEKKSQPKKALEYAKKAFAASSTNQDAKAMVVRLGGKIDDSRVDGSERSYAGDQLMRAGDFFAAQAEFKAAFDANPKDGIAAMKAGKCLWELNQTTDAIEWMRKAVAADPNLVGAYVLLADYYAQRYDYLSAMQVLQKVQRLQPQSYEVYRGYAAVSLRRKDYKSAITFGQRALKIYDTDHETILIMAKAHLGLREFQEALRYASRATELDYSSVEAQSVYAKAEAGVRGVDSGALYVQSLINRYVVTKNQQIPQAAIDLRVTLGEIYMQDERYKQAEEAFRQAISLDPNNKPALLGLAGALQAQNFNPQALETFLKAAVLDPSDADPIYRSGQLYLDVGKLGEAIRQFERVLKINSRYPLGHVALGRVYLQQGDSKRALEEAAKEKENNPDLGEAYLLAAESYYAQKQYSNCATEYQKASQRIQTANVMVRMARCYRLSGSVDAAQSMLRRAQSIESGNPDLYKEQGAIFHMKGMADEAIAAYDTYLKLVPAAADRAEIEARMRRVQSGDLDVGE